MFNSCELHTYPSYLDHFLQWLGYLSHFWLRDKNSFRCPRGISTTQEEWLLTSSDHPSIHIKRIKSSHYVMWSTGMESNSYDWSGVQFLPIRLLSRRFVILSFRHVMSVSSRSVVRCVSVLCRFFFVHYLCSFRFGMCDCLASRRCKSQH